MDRQAAREYTARSGNGFIYVALGIVLIAFGVVAVLGRPSLMMENNSPSFLSLISCLCRFAG